MFWRLLSVALLASALASAQRGGRGGDDEGGGAREMRPRSVSKFEQFADKLKLNGDQKTEARTIIMEAAKETGPLQQQLMKARENLASALITANTEQTDQALAVYGPLVAQLTAVEAKSFGKICALLKPGQQSKAGQAFELLAAMYEPTPTNQNRGRRGDR